MVRSRFTNELATLVGLAAVYFVAGKLGLKLALVNVSATALWPCTGIALATFLVLGYRVWPAILAGAFLVNLTTAGTLSTSLVIAIGNTLEGNRHRHAFLRGIQNELSAAARSEALYLK